MKVENSRQDEVLISIADFISALKKKKKFILLCAFAFGFFAFIINLMKIPTYEAKGTFKEKSMNQVALEGQLQTALGLGKDSSTNSTISLMGSHKVMDKVVKALNLQVSLTKKKSRSTWDNLYKNLKAIKANFFKGPHGSYSGPILKDEEIGLACTKINYNGKYAKKYNLKFISDEQFILMTTSSKPQLFNINNLVVLDELEFCLERNNSIESLNGSEYILNIYPLYDVASSLIKNVKLEKDTKDKSLIKVSYSSSNPKMASFVVNEVMIRYKDFLEEDNNKSIQDQLTYLNYRKNEVDLKLSAIMEQHADYLKKKIVEFGGFPDASLELSFLSAQQAELKNRIFELDRTRALLESEDDLNAFYGDNSISKDQLFSDLFIKKTEMQQKYNSFALDIYDRDIALEEVSKDHLKDNFEHLSFIQKKIDDIEELLNQLKKAGSAKLKVALIEASALIPPPWKNTTYQRGGGNDCNQNLFDFSNDSSCYLEAIENYLDNQKKLYYMQLELFKSRLLFQKDYDINFRGLSLDSSEKLFVEFNEKLTASISSFNLYTVAENQLQDPTFQITALTSTLSNDPIVTNLVTEASIIQKRLHDMNNLSNKEAERLRSDLNVKKNFLIDHVSFVKEGNIKETALLKSRLFDLKKAIMDILNREITVVNNQLSDYKKSRIESIHQENLLIQNLITKLNESIADLPDKWFAEKKLENITESQKTVIAEVAKLVEARNISGNINKSESSPLDFAYEPIISSVKPIFIFTFLFTFLGAIFASFIVIFKVLFNGVIVSKENLMLMGKNVLGTLSGRDDEDLKVAREAVSFISDDSKAITFVNPLNIGLITLIASLIVKKGKKTIILDITFLNYEEVVSKEDSSLKNYLEGNSKILRPHVVSYGYDYIYGGSYTAFGVELLQRKEFFTFLEALKNQYDFILINLPISSISSEAHYLKDLGDKHIVLLKEEKLSDMGIYLREDRHHYGFVFTH